MRKSARKTAKTTARKPARSAARAATGIARATGKARAASKTAPARTSARAGIPAYGGIGSEAVANATGKSWPEWLEILDTIGARQMDHKQIVAYLVSRNDVGPWWQQ